MVFFSRDRTFLQQPHPAQEKEGGPQERLIKERGLRDLETAARYQVRPA